MKNSSYNTFRKIRSFTLAVSCPNNVGGTGSSAHDVSLSIEGVAIPIGVGKYASPQKFILGDTQDFDGEKYLGNGVHLDIDHSQKTVSLKTSLTGLPPVFLYKDEGNLVLSSSIENLIQSGRIGLEFNNNALHEFAVIGKPLEHRTLFKNLTLLPAGLTLSIDLIRADVRESWAENMRLEKFTSYDHYVDAQITAMEAALSRMDLSETFLALTAGLDTRAILAMLSKSNDKIPAYTMSGKVRSLDARRASSLCKELGINHQISTMDSNFFDSIPEYSVIASRKSGGLLSLAQAFEVNFYENLPNAFQARLSGNLGNQIGRSGTEGAGVRGVNESVFSADFLAEVKQTKKTEKRTHRSSKLAQLQEENLFSSVGNYSLGSSYALQRTPYADRAMILNKIREPDRKDSEIGNPTAIRLRDLKHRLLGYDAQKSFQRKIVVKSGGAVEKIPINWGWRASGNISLEGYFWGALALFDFIAINENRPLQVPTPDFIKNRIQGIYGFQSINLMKDKNTKHFVLDMASTLLAKGSSIFNRQFIEKSLAGRVDDQQGRKIAVFMLDIALACRNFNATFRV